MLAKDKVEAIRGEPIRSFEDIQKIVAANPLTTLGMTVTRDGKRIELTVVTEAREVKGKKVGLLGIRGGTVYGASDSHAAYVKDRPVSTSDICATIYDLLGIDPDMHVYDNDRPVPIAHGGQPIREIMV